MLRLVFTISLVFPFFLAAEEKRLHVTIDAGEHDRIGTLVSVVIPETSTRRARLFVVGDEGAPPLPAQIVKAESTRLEWFLATPLPAGETREYRVAFIDTPDHEGTGGVICEETETALSLRSGDRPILSYLKAPSPAATEAEPIYSRTGYIHPLLTPSGLVVTGDYPVDHPHQHALFHAWTKCRFEGRDINFWDQKRGKGRVAHTETVSVVSGPVFGQFVTRQRHEDLTTPDHPRPVLDETWKVKAYRGTDSYHLIDLETRQECATESPLEIQQYHYGGMALRGTSQWFDPDKEAPPPGHFLTSEGMTRLDGNHSRPDWVAMHGPVDERKAGVAVFSHPDNFRSPQWVRLHPTKPYFVFTPMVEEGFSISPETPYVARFRYLVFDGEIDRALLERIWTDFAFPPKSTFLTTHL